MNLQDTIEMMNSQDYKERFKAEYFQTLIRYARLRDMVQKFDKGELDFVPTCPIITYEFQLKAMGEYLGVLQMRANMEGISLEIPKQEETSKPEEVPTTEEAQ